MFDFSIIGDDEYEMYNEYIAGSPYGNFRQTTYWGEIKSLSGWNVEYYALKKENRIVGVASIFIRKIPFMPLSINYCCRGPIVDWEDKTSSNAILNGLYSVVKRNHGLCLRIDPEPFTCIEKQEKHLIEGGLTKLKTRVTQWNRNLYTARVMLDKDEDQLFSQMRRTHRQNINKAMRLGVTIDFNKNDEDKNELYRLMRGLESRKNSIIHEKNYYDKLYKSIVENNVGYFIKAQYEGVNISGIVVAVLNDKAWALFVANDYEYRELMPNKLLIWEAIKLAKKLGCRFLDLGATQGTEKFDPNNDSLDMLKKAYCPYILEYPGYYDAKGLLYEPFRFTEIQLLPLLMKIYYKINRFIGLSK